MPLINTTIQNLLNGVSQQADSQRFPSQAQEQINGLSSPVAGLSKRNPTEHISKVFSSVPTNVWSEALNRDATERYMVTVRNSSWKTFTATNATDLFTSAAHGYSDGEAVRLYTAAGTLPSGVVATARYYIISSTTNTFQLSTTSGGSAVALADDGSGTLSVGLDPISVVDVLTGTEKTVTTTNSANYLVATTPSSTFKSTSIADYTFISNTSKTVAMSSTTSTDTRYRAYVYIKQGDYGTDYHIELDGTRYSHATDTGANRDYIDSEYIAEQLHTALGTPSGFDTPVINGSTIEIKKTDGSDFEITTHDGLNDLAMKAIKFDAPEFLDLPLYCRDGTICRVQGSTEQNSDDYYVKFTSNSPTNEPFGEGYWTETVEPGIEYKLDASTMPHTLIRESDGNFTFKEVPWFDMDSGDTTTNPNPSFVGSTIKNVVLFRDRLGFLSGENISLSETGEYFNFFRTTVTQLLGSDPVDVRASHNKVSILRDALPFNRNLILFSDRTQFMLTGGDVLSPSTVSISQETEFEVDNTASPELSGRNIYFPFTRGDYSGLMEYFISPDTEQMDGQDVTSHIPKYIAGSIKKITASSSDPTIVLTSASYSSGFFVYKYMFNGRQKLQSSWSKFSLGSNATIENVDFIERDLYLVVSRTSGLFIEKMSFKVGVKDANAAYTTCLDRRIKESDCSLSYDAATQQTTITLPYTAHETMEVCSRADGGSEKEGTRFKVLTQGSTSLTLDGDLTSRKLWIGEKYNLEYTLSKPYLKQATEGGGKANVSSGRFQVKNGTLTFDNTIAFSVQVSPEGRSTSTHKFINRTIGASSFTTDAAQETKDGSFRFPVQSRGDRVDIKLVNDTPFPSNFLSMEYEALYHSRSQRAR